MKSTNRELADWILEFPEDEMSYHIVAFNGCGAVAFNSNRDSLDEMIDAFKYAAMTLAHD